MKPGTYITLLLILFMVSFGGVVLVHKAMSNADIDISVSDFFTADDDDNQEKQTSSLKQGQQTPLPKQEPRLKNIAWALHSINGKPIDARVDTRIIFDQVGKIGGKLGCNGFAIDYQADDNGTLVIYPMMIGTKMMCPPHVMAVEDRLSQLIIDTNAYELKDADTLILRTHSGTRYTLKQKP